MDEITDLDLLIAHQTTVTALALILCDVAGISREEMSERLSEFRSETELANVALASLAHSVSCETVH